MKTVVVYHASSLDGFSGAWAFRKHLPGVELIPGTQYSVPPNIRKSRVYMIGFTYEIEHLRRLIAEGNTVYMLGRHPSAERIIAQEPDLGVKVISLTLDNGQTATGGECAWHVSYQIWAKEKGVAGPAVPPVLLSYIADAHRYEYILPNSRFIRCALDSEPRSFDNWDELMLTPDEPEALQFLVDKGEIVHNTRSKMAAAIIRATRRYMRIGGFSIPVANCPSSLASDVANTMAIDREFAAIYYDTPKSRHFELRSRRDSGFDVLAIALKYGGGGHHNAAGFTVPRNHVLARI